MFCCVAQAQASQRTLPHLLRVLPLPLLEPGKAAPLPCQSEQHCKYVTLAGLISLGTRSLSPVGLSAQLQPAQ